MHQPESKEKSYVNKTRNDWMSDCSILRNME